MEELLGNNPRVLKSGETRVDEYQKLWNNITMGSQWRGVFHNKRKNGELYWESSTISPIVDARGKITHYLAVKEDITDKKMAEEELRKFQTISESADYGNVISDLDGNLLYSNKCFAEMQGYEVSEIIGKNLSMLHSEQQMIRVVESLELLRSKGKFQAEEIWRTRKDGTTFPSLMNAMIIKDEAGKPLFLSATVIDITEKKIKDAEISKLSQAIEQSPILVVITDLSGNIIYVNPAFEVTTGYTRQEIMGKNPRILNSGKLDKSFFKDLWDTIVQGKEWKGELINRKKNGELYWENMSVTPIQDSSGRITNYLAIKQDITGSKENEQKIQELNASLELKVEERTAQLTQTNEELAKEIEDRKLKEAFELELLQLSLQLTGIAASESQHAISLSLERIGRFTGADRTFVFEIDPEGETFSASFEWSSVPDQLSVKTQKSIPMNLLPKWWEHLRQGKPITIPDLDALPESWASEKSILKPYGDKSILVVPMFSEEKLIGYCGMATVRERKEFGKEEVNLLTIWSGMLTSVLNNIHAGFLLDQTRKNYETFFNTLDDFLWILDNEGTIIHFNNTALVRLGFTLEELGGKSILMVHPDERRQEAEVLLGRLLSGSSEVFSIPLRAKSGLVIPVETKAIDGYWNGKPVIFMASKDISQIKLSEEKFSTAFQSNSAMMAISDFNNGNFVDVNHAFLELFGYTREEVIGKTSKQLNLFADNSLRDEILMKLSHNIPVRKIELPMVTKTGEIKTGLLSADTVIVGTTRCMLTVTLDITDLKKMEEQLKAAHEEANRANVAKSEFLSRMSHELRTPMNSILGFAQLIEMGELNPRQAKGIKHILNSGKHLLDLINEVLEISRIEAGKLSLSLEPIQIQGIIQEMMEIVWPLAKDRQLTLDLISSNLDQLYVLADRQRLKQVLLNLISNAVKYNIPGGSIWISATLMTENVHGSVPVRISITDTGLGIARESISRLFNPFERVGAENSATEGTGLGLAVVKKLVEAMGGSVGVESVVGEGSTFWIDLPQTESQLKQFNKSENYTDFVHSLSNLAGTILYIEDNTSNIELVEQILFSHCNLIKLISNRNGRDALRLALEHRPDLILLDLNLPDMHGSEVLDLLRSNPDARQIPVVVISADATAQQLEKLKKKGAEDYLTKPLDVREFLKMINRTVGSN
jgi:PAS domain S-box-containing protein